MTKPDAERLPPARSMRLACALAMLAALLPLGAQAADALMVQVRDPAARARLLASGALIEDYGSYLVIHARADAAARALGQPGDVVALSRNLRLRGYDFDPLESDPLSTLADPRARYASLDEAGVFVVQFSAPVRDVWLDALRSTGLQVLQYLPDQAFLVRGPASAARTAQTLAHVRYLGPYHPAYKLAPDLRGVYASSPNTPAPPARYELGVAHADAGPALQIALAQLGGVVQQRLRAPGSALELLRVDLASDALIAVTRMPGVLTIDRYFPAVAEDERAAQIVAGNLIDALTLAEPGYDPQVQFGASGANVTVAVSDDGVGIPGDGDYYISAANAVHGPLRGASANASGHGHLQACIIAGAPPHGPLDEQGYNYGMGVAPAAHIVSLPFIKPNYSGTDVDAANDAVSTPGPNGVRASISNNSWGNGLNGNQYDALAALYDALVQDASSGPGIDPLLIVFSAGNASTAGLTRPKMAKNVLSVAASENIRPEWPSAGGSTQPADNAEELPDFSSRGPAADGRVKPDITAPGDVVSGGRSGSGGGINVDLYARVASGTSHAAPQVAGAAALYTQAWKSSHGGVNPSPAMIKAALLNGAVDMSGNGASEAIPNGDEGWGRINLKNVLNTAVPVIALDQQVRLTEPGELYRFYGHVASSSAELRIALVWTDPPGFGDPALVNNLDLEADIDGILYRGNVWAGGYSMVNGSADIRNNVEMLRLPVGLNPGMPIRLRVRATTLNGDGVLGNSDGTDQNFALVCFNCVEDPGFRLDVDATTASACAGLPFQRPLQVQALAGFNGAVTLAASGLPGAASASFAPNPVLAGQSSVLTLSSSTLASGSYTLALTGSAGALLREASFGVYVAAALPATPMLLSPLQDATAVPANAALQWSASAQAYDYRVEVASDAAFDQVVASTITRSNAWVPQPTLAAGTRYYWRVIARNACADALVLHANGFESGAPTAGIVSATGRYTTAE